MEKCVYLFWDFGRLELAGWGQALDILASWPGRVFLFSLPFPFPSPFFWGGAPADQTPPAAYSPSLYQANFLQSVTKGEEIQSSQ